MPIVRNVKVLRPLLACLLLGAFGSAAAVTHEVSMHGPNGDGGGDCSDPTETAPASTAPAKTSPTPISQGSKAKPAISGHGATGDDGSSRAPRWHSFLPGMFR